MRGGTLAPLCAITHLWIKTWRGQEAFRRRKPPAVAHNWTDTPCYGKSWRADAPRNIVAPPGLGGPARQKTCFSAFRRFLLFAFKDPVPSSLQRLFHHRLFG